jgi:hypothetical protein
MPDTHWDPAQNPPPAIGRGEVLEHPMYGDVVVEEVLAGASFPRYWVAEVARPSHKFVTSAAFLS